MNTINTNASYGSYNSFGFSLQTSSGDTIDLSMYDAKFASLSQESSQNSQSTSLTLAHAYGYSFKYEGNGIDANDKKEIDEAMKLIQPMMDDYFKSIKEDSTQASNAKTNNTAYAINDLLPKNKLKNEATQNYTNDSLLKNIDTILAKSENQNKKMLEEAQKLFDAVLKQQKSFELYI